MSAQFIIKFLLYYLMEKSLLKRFGMHEKISLNNSEFRRILNMSHAKICDTAFVILNFIL
jgi:hypothetical protein